MSELRYPDPKDVDEQLLGRLQILPDGSKINLEWIKLNIRTEESIESFNIPTGSVIRGMQANMHALDYKTESGDRRLICKRIFPKELPEKKSLDSWIQFLKSVRRELKFYEVLMEVDHDPIRDLFPKTFHYSSTPEQGDNDQPKDAGFIMVMEDLSDRFFQTPAFEYDHALSTLVSLSRLHAHFWNNSQVLDKLERGGFWTLQRRKHLGELDGANEKWELITSRFPEMESLGLDHLKEIPIKLLGICEKLNAFIDERCFTLIHGDCKCWNLFLGKNESKTILIDMQWMGKGHPLQDVAYFLTTSLKANLLEKWEDLLHIYLDNLELELAKKNISFDVKAMGEEYDLIWLDYARVIITGLWVNLTKERIKAYEKTVGPSMINRSLDHVLFIVKKLHHILYESPGHELMKLA